MAPAAYHRHAMQRAVTDGFLHLGSRLVSSALLVLALGLSIKIFIVARLVTDSFPASTAIAAAVLCLLLALWVALPRWHGAAGNVEK